MLVTTTTMILRYHYPLKERLKHTYMEMISTLVDLKFSNHGWFTITRNICNPKKWCRLKNPNFTRNFITWYIRRVLHFTKPAKSRAKPSVSEFYHIINFHVNLQQIVADLLHNQWFLIFQYRNNFTNLALSWIMNPSQSVDFVLTVSRYMTIPFWVGK